MSQSIAEYRRIFQSDQCESLETGYSSVRIKAGYYALVGTICCTDSGAGKQPLDTWKALRKLGSLKPELNFKSSPSLEQTSFESFKHLPHLKHHHNPCSGEDV